MKIPGILFAAMMILIPVTASAQGFTDPRVAALVQAQAPRQEQPPVVADVPLPTEDPCANPQPFGQSLFDGAIEKSRNAIMSSSQRVVPGDRIALALWGAVQSEETVTVDSQGFIYVKGAGPVHVEGKTEETLGHDIRAELSRVFKDDVQVYARLEQSSGTPVMVTGGVKRPGQYYGSASDSVVVWLQRAGGILAQEGSYRNISIIRDGQQLQTVDLYPFLINGLGERISWKPGDVVVVNSITAQIAATGDVKRCALFEFSSPTDNGGSLQTLALPLPAASHAILKGIRSGAPFSQVYSLTTFANAPVMDGDSVQFYAAPQSRQITVTVEGLTLGNKKLVLPINARLSEALAHIPVDQNVSDTSSIFIKRESVARMQQEALNETVNRLLQSALTAPAQSDGEALIRAKEAELIEGFVTRVKDVKQEGRVVVMQGGELRDLPLENGDVIVVPQKTNIVSIEGEIVLPRAVVVRDKATAEDYVKMAGGYTERALKNDYIIIRPNGDAIREKNPEIRAGDRLLILPRVDTKTMQTTKDIVQILYQIAVGAGVLIKL